MSRPDFLETARSALQTYYPGYACAFVAGSMLRGEATDRSDIDILVLFPDGFEDVHRYSVTENTWPIEFFVHSVEANSYFVEQDRKRGMCVMMDMIASGLVLGPETDLADERKTMARRLIEQGPPRLSEREVKAALYRLESLVDDLDEERPLFESMAVLASLLNAVGDFVLRSAGKWSGSGKALARLLKDHDPSLASKLEMAFQTASRGELTLMRALCDGLIQSHGGSVFEDYRVDAVPSWKNTES